MRKYEMIASDAIPKTVDHLSIELHETLLDFAASNQVE